MTWRHKAVYIKTEHLPLLGSQMGRQKTFTACARFDLPFALTQQDFVTRSLLAWSQTLGSIHSTRGFALAFAAAPSLVIGAGAGEGGKTILFRPDAGRIKRVHGVPIGHPKHAR